MPARVRWRRIRPGHEKEDQSHNERLAAAVLTDPVVDSAGVALDQVGWQITPKDGHQEPWPLQMRSPICPSWCTSISEQEKAISRGLEAVAVIDRH